MVGFGFDNKGTVTASGGPLRFTGGGVPGETSAGTFTASDAGSEIEFRSGNFTAGRWDLAGKVGFSGANITATRVAGATSDATISGGKLTLTDTAAASQLKTLKITNGTLAGTANVTATDGLTWSGGTMSGTGETTLPAGSTSSISPSGSVLLDGRPLRNAGTLTWGSGIINGANGAAITNTNTWHANSESSLGLNPICCGTTPTFSNKGTVDKDDGTGQTTLNFQLDNDKEVRVKRGKLSLGTGAPPASTGDGKLCAEGPSSIVMTGGPWTFGETEWCGNIKVAGATVTATSIQQTTKDDGQPTDDALADVEISSGSLALTSTTEDTQLRSLTMSGGTLTGAGSANIFETLNWTGGAMAGTGTTSLEPLAQSTIAPSSSVLLDTRKLDNAGTLTWPTGTINGANGATITNTGTWHANSESGFGLNPICCGTSPRFLNTGMLDKVAGTGTTLVGFQLANPGHVNGGAGTLRFTGGGTPATTSPVLEPPAMVVCIPNPPEPAHGIMTTSGTADIDLGGGCYTIGGGSTIAGNLKVSGANVTVYDPEELSGGLAISSGSYVIKTPSTSADFDTLTIDGGILENPGDIACEDQFRWRGGTLGGPGQITIAPTCTGVVDPPGSGIATLSAQTLTNQGVITWSSGGINAGQGATIQNAGSLRANSESGPLAYSSAVGGLLPWFDNCGQLEKTAGSGTTTISTLFTTCEGAPTPGGSIVFSGDDETDGLDDTPRSPRIGEPDGPTIDEVIESIKRHVGARQEEYDDFDDDVRDAIEHGRSKEAPDDRTIYQKGDTIVIFNASTQKDGELGTTFRRPTVESAEDYYDSQPGL